MTVACLAGLPDLTVIYSGEETRDFVTVHTSDLLSDVLANAPQGALLVTVQAHLNTAAVAVQKNMPAVVVCSNRPLPEDFVQSCRREHIGLFVTPLTQYEFSGRLFCLLNPGYIPARKT